MSTVAVIHSRYSDNLAATAAISIETGTAATGYPASQVADYNAARPSKLNEASGAWLFDMTTAKSIAIAAIAHHNFQAALDVRLQANATNAWGGPSFEAAFTIPAWRADRFPGQPWLDLAGLAGWGPYRYWRLVVVGTNPVPLAVGDVWLGSTLRRFDRNVQKDHQLGFDQPRIEHQTAYKRLRTPLGTTVYSFVGDLDPATPQTAQDVFDWMLDAAGRPSLFIPDGTKNEASLYLHTQSAQSMKRHYIASNAVHLDLIEDGRGLEPTPSPL